MIQQSHSWVSIRTKLSLKKTHAPTCMFTAALSTTAKTWKQPKCPSIDDWIRKMWYIYTMVHNGILLSHQKEQNNAICSDMELETHTKWSKSERERQIPYDITFICNLIYGTNEPFHRKETHGLGEKDCGCQGGGGGSGMDWTLGLRYVDSCIWSG